MSALLEVRGLSLRLPLAGSLLSALLPGAARHLLILDDISFSLATGETLGLVGESGSGKTTLARAVLGLGHPAEGEVQFDGHAVTRRRDDKRLRRATAMMFQDAVASLSPRMSVGTLLTEPYAIHAVPVADRAAKARELLALVGLPPELAQRYPGELSGGQARRVGVARALALQPKLVVADEPTAGLDVSVQGEILNLMTDLKTRLHLSYLIVTHNLAMVRHVSDRIAVMYLGQLVEIGPTRRVFAAAAHPYTQSLIASEPLPDPRRRRGDLAIRGEIPSLLHRPGGCAFHTRCALVQARCRTEAPDLRQLSETRAARCHFARVDMTEENDDDTEMAHGSPRIS